MVRWAGQQLSLGVRPGLSGSLLRCQYIINATPALVLATVLIYFALAAVMNVPVLARISLLQLPIPVVGLLWFRYLQQRGRMPNYWEVCLLCQATVLTGILGGQGTLISTHYYFLFFALTTPLVVPLHHRWSVALIALECLGMYIFFELVGGPAADPELVALDAHTLQLLRLSVTVCCSVTLFGATLLSEQILRQLEEKIVRMANTDALTGLPNRRRFQEVVEGALARALRGGPPMCLAVFDLDHFKTVNDTHGHEAGDEVLRQVSSLLDQARRRGDHLARIGGEEFALVMEHTDQRHAHVALERMRRAVQDSDLRLSDTVTLKITLSVGLARWHAPDSDKALVAQADEALYAAKRQGRNRVVVASR